MEKRIIFFIFLTVLIISCDSTTRISSIDNRSQQVNSLTTNKNKTLDSFLSPYRVALEKKMNDTLAFLDKEMKKTKVESELGNWVADGMQWYVTSVLKEDADISICNYGGLRIKSLPRGAIKLKHIYELMPFENELTIVRLDSNELKVLLHRIADKEGWPVSKELKLSISKENKLNRWTVRNTTENDYYVVLSDYISNGGDGMDILVRKPKKMLNVLIRDALIAYAKHQHNLSAVKDGRITKEDNYANE